MVHVLLKPSRPTIKSPLYRWSSPGSGHTAALHHKGTVGIIHRCIRNQQTVGALPGYFGL